LDNRRVLLRDAVDLGAVRCWAEPVFVGVLLEINPERVLEHLRKSDGGDEPLDDGEGNRSFAPAFVGDTADGDTFTVRRRNQHVLQTPGTIDVSARQGEWLRRFLEAEWACL